MSSKKPKLTPASLLTSSAKPIRRRRRTSASKDIPDQSHYEAAESPEIILEQPTPTRSNLQWPTHEQESVLEQPNVSSKKDDISMPSPSQTRSESTASSASTSSIEESDPDSPVSHSNRGKTQILSPLPTTAQIHPLVASLRSSHSRSPNRAPQSPTPPYLANLGPQFHNRPSTPLPASPSLISLLRPAFSRSPSRQTTPDHSETEHSFSPSITPFAGVSTPDVSTARLLDTAKTANPVPRANPKVPTYEYYGFALYVTSSVAFLGYILWSYLPSAALHWLGIYYYPDRWWSLAIPAWTVMLVVFIYVALAAYNSEVLTLPLGSLGAIVDEVGVVAVVDQNGRLVGKGRIEDIGDDGNWRWRDAWSHSTDAVLDVPIGGACEVLYGDG